MTSYPSSGPTPFPNDAEIFTVNEYRRTGNTFGEDAWNVFQIQSEFIQGFGLGHSLQTGVTVYGSARTHAGTQDYSEAEKVGELLARHGLATVTGGGPGIMEAANKGAYNQGGVSVGLGIQLEHEQSLNPFITHSLQFEHFFSRKTMLVRYSSGFVCFPGGYGTLDEVFELLCLIQTHKKEECPVVLFGSAYWSGLIQWMKNVLVERSLISESDIDMFFVTDSPQEAVDYIVQGIAQLNGTDTQDRV